MRVHSQKQAAHLVVMLSMLAIVLHLGWPRPAQAQAVGATLSGVVTDSSGAAIANAAVAIKNQGTGDLREQTTNADGIYSAPNLIPGLYDVSVTAKGFKKVVQPGITLTVGAQRELNLSLKPGETTEVVEVTDTPPDVQTTTSAVISTVDSRTVRELPLNGRDWTTLATLEPGIVNIPNQATTSFSANKGNRGFGNQLSDSGHRPNENSYRVNGISINDYSNAAPGGATGLNLGVDSVQEFSVITTGYTAEYGRTSGAIINAITKSGSNQFHGTGFFFDRDKVFDARNFFDLASIPPFRRIQFGGSGGGPIIKGKTFIFANYEGVRQSQSASGSIKVPTQEARGGLLCVPDANNPCASLNQVTVDPNIVPYLALWPCAATCQNTTNADAVTLGVAVPNHASENYFITRLDHRLSSVDSLAGSYSFDSGPQSQADPLGNTVHQVLSRRQTGTFEETHVFTAALVNTFRAGLTRVVGKINDPVSGNAVATDATLAIAPGAKATPQIPVSGLTTAFGLGGFNRFSHAWNSLQVADDAFLTHGTHSIKFGFAFERMQYNVLEQLSPNGRMSTYSLADFLENNPKKLNALAPGGSHEVGFRESLFAGYVQDDWRLRPNLTLNLGLRYEMTTRPSDANRVPGYTVNGYTVAAAGFQEIISFSNCTPGTTACGPVGVDSPILSNPTNKNFEPRIGVEWDPFHSGKTVIRAGAGMFDVLPLPYVFGLNTAATAPFQIIGADPAATLGTGVADTSINFDPQKIRNRFIDPHPHRAYVTNWNLNVQRELPRNWTLLAGYVGSRSVHLSAAADDVNLVQPQVVDGVVVFPSPGTRVDSNWGGGAGIRPVLFDGASSYNGFQAQVKHRLSQGVQGQASYSFGKCRDLSSAPVTGDTFLNSIAVPLLMLKSARVGPCDFDIRHTFSGTMMWEIPSIKNSSALVSALTGGWELGTIVTATSGAPFTVTYGGGDDPLGTGFNGDFSMDFATLIAGCNPISGRKPFQPTDSYLNVNCFTPPTAPDTLPVATAQAPFGCVPNSFPIPAPAGMQYCSNVLGNSGRNSFHGPRLTTLDLSIFKNTRITAISETFNIQFRAEFFNVLNHANFLSPGFLNTFGQNNSVIRSDNTVASGDTALNQTSTSSRQIQLGLKLIW